MANEQPSQPENGEIPITGSGFAYEAPDQQFGVADEDTPAESTNA